MSERIKIDDNITNLETFFNDMFHEDEQFHVVLREYETSPTTTSSYITNLAKAAIRKFFDYNVIKDDNYLEIDETAIVMRKYKSFSDKLFNITGYEDSIRIEMYEDEDKIYPHLSNNSQIRLKRTGKKGIVENTSNIYLRDINFIKKKLSDAYYVEDLEKEINQLEQTLLTTKEKLSNYNFILSFMKENNIDAEKKDVVKSKLIHKQIEANKEDREDKETLLTNINEILSINI